MDMRNIEIGEMYYVGNSKKTVIKILNKVEFFKQKVYAAVVLCEDGKFKESGITLPALISEFNIGEKVNKEIKTWI